MMTQPTMMIVAAVVIALWVLFSGGSPVIKYVVYRALFVAFAVVSALFTIQTFSASGLGPAILAAGALLVSWTLFIGPITSGVLGFRKNPKQLTHTNTTTRLANQL